MSINACYEKNKINGWLSFVASTKEKYPPGEMIRKSESFINGWINEELFVIFPLVKY